MRLRGFVLLLSLIILLGFSSVVFANDQMPGFGIYHGEVKAADGTLLKSGKIQAYMNGQAIALSAVDIKDGKFDGLTIKAGADSENQPIEFKVLFNNKEYVAVSENEVLWNFMDYEEVKLGIDAETGSTGTSTPNQERVQLSVESTDVNLKVGSNRQLTVTVFPSDASVLYSSSSTSVASVSSGGLITAVGQGTAAITVTASKTGYTTGVAEIKVTVTDDNKVQVSVTPASFTLKPGDTQQINVATTPAGAAVAFTSGNTGVATVNSSGLITAVAKGTAVITVTASNDGFENGKADVSVSVSETTATGGGGGTAPSSQANSFSDVPSTHWAAGVIGKLSGKGIVGGYPGGLFKPENNISRAEFIKILTGAIGLAEEKTEAPLFSDVPSSQWYFGCIQAAAKAGLSKGYDTGEFRPEAQITRQEMAVILIRAMGKDAAAAGEKTSFADDADIASWARGFVVTAVGEKLVSGYTDNTFRPNNNATRAEACAMISKLMEKK